MINLSLLKTGFSSLGIDLADECIDLLDSFSDMVAEQNKSFNLTALTEPDAFTEKHIVDSLAALPFIPHGSSVCDVGAGAGFPSVPIAIARPDTTVTALDSTAKKSAHMRERFSTSSRHAPWRPSPSFPNSRSLLLKRVEYSLLIRQTPRRCSRKDLFLCSAQG